MTEDRLIEKLAEGNTLHGSDAASLLAKINAEGWRAGVRIALVYLQLGKTEQAKAALESLLEEPEPVTA